MHVAAHREFNDAPRDLHRPDERRGEHRIARREARARQQADHVRRKRGGEKSPQRERRSEPREDRRMTNRLACCTTIGIGVGVSGPCSRKHQPVDRHAHEQVERSKYAECRAPARRVEQELRERPEHGARESAEERQRRHGLPIGGAGDSMQRGKCRIVEAACHRETGEHESGHQRCDPLGEREHGKPDGAERRAPGKNCASAARIDQASHRWRSEAGSEQSSREAAENRDVA